MQAGGEKRGLQQARAERPGQAQPIPRCSGEPHTSAGAWGSSLEHRAVMECPKGKQNRKQRGSSFEHRAVVECTKGKQN
ncbi:hypothetical protein NDU88_008851 [Pleurodeles waltl]|uniref:Uncharacterized protein n=1 Tax=Pleurodeles waltl TaxID=8319 RepID=A0AAV7RWQ8_PLEWA|nr:hypothetical protein NDU88_008851 [Pleurodeles waltl]